MMFRFNLLSFMSLQGINFLSILDELLLDILKDAGDQSTNIKTMEESVFRRTGYNFSTLHNKVWADEMECESQGIEDYIENDSRLLGVHNSVVWARISLSSLKQGTRKQVTLDLSNHRITSCRDLVKKCVQARNATRAFFRESIIISLAWPFSVLDLLCWFCPCLRQIDITGCKGFSKNILADVSDESQVEIVDYLDPFFILKSADVGKQIRELLERKSISTSVNCKGWSLLHSATLLRDIELVKQLIKCMATDKSGDINNIQDDLLQTSLELATVLHDLEIVELLRCEHNVPMDPSSLIQHCFLTRHGYEGFDHSVIETLSSNEDALQAAKNLHDSLHCNVIVLLQTLCRNGDINFKKKVLEELFRKVHSCIGSDCCLLFSCWNEKAIRDAVQILMTETGCLANGKIDSFPYLMFALPSEPLLKFLLTEGAKIDEKDHLGCTALFHAVEKALTTLPAYHLGWISLIQFLLDSQANPNLRNNHGEAPLSYSLMWFLQSCEFCSKMMTHATVDPRCYDFFEDQVVAVWRLLLTAEARANIKDEMDRSLLHLLLKFLEDGIFQPRVCLALVCKGLTALQNGGLVINARDAEGNTPLHFWARFWNDTMSDVVLEIGNKLIFHGGAVNARNDNGETPLHLSQSWKQVDFLVVKGAQAKAQDLNGNTPFHKFIPLIAHQVSKAQWKKYLTLGMDPFCVNHDKKCLLDVLLEKMFFKSALNLFKTIFENDQNKDLAESAISYKDQKGDSLLHIVCVMENKGAQLIFEYLLQKGCKVNLQNERKVTPLHLVCSKLQNENAILRKNICLLRMYHADTSVPDGNGNTCDALLSKDLHNLLHDKIEKISMPNKIKWKQESANHKAALAEVARGTNYRRVDSYYHHEKHIGEGSFSLVFPAINEKDGREVAMKRLEKARLEKNGALFEREVKCLLELSNCTFVVNYISCTSDSNFQYLVVELMEGALDGYLSCDEECNQAFTICVNIASGIEFLHAKNVLHRDLKPQNVLYKTRPQFIVKISDFGLSKILQGVNIGAQSESVLHSRAGTRCWMAPELLKKKPKVQSKASDIFSCGLLFHYVVAKKKHPFGSYSGESPPAINLQETEGNITNNQKRFCESLTPEAINLLSNMLLHKPKKRPAAASLQRFPFFWDDRKKIEFLAKVGNQTEFEEPRSHLKRPLTDVENNLEADYSNAGYTDWKNDMQEVYDAVTAKHPHRTYDTTSAVELVRFIRNSYTHSYRLPENIKELLWKNFVVLERFPFLVAALFKNVKASGTWRTREDLNNFFK